MREKHHHGHEQDEIGKDLPMAGGGPNDGANGWCAVLLPGLRFTNLGPNIERQQGGGAASPEHCPPAPNRGQWKDEACCHRREQVAYGISALQDSGEHSAPAWRSALHCQGSADSPLSTHPDPVNSPQQQKERVIGGKPAEKFDHGKENNVGHEWLSPAVAVGKHSKDQRPHRTHRQRRYSGENDLFSRDLELCGQRVYQEHQDEEVKSIERPAQKTGTDRVPLIDTRRVCAYLLYWRHTLSSLMGATDRARETIRPGDTSHGDNTTESPNLRQG